MQTTFEAKDLNGKLKRYQFDSSVILNGNKRDKWTSFEYIDSDGAWLYSGQFTTPNKATKTQIIEREFYND